jgi:hypothetical protein
LDALDAISEWPALIHDLVQRVLLPSEDFLAVILEETFTPAEKTLIARGEADGIQDIRRRFQRSMADQAKAVVEQATGRAVRSFLKEDGPRQRHLG